MKKFDILGEWSLTKGDRHRVSILYVKAGVHLNGIFAPLNTGLVQISPSHFKQSKNSMLKT